MGSQNGNTQVLEPETREKPNGGGSLLKEKAYAGIKRDILNGEFAPGSFLSERQLAVRLGMSKTPIRAALERLDLEGFVAVSPQQGIIVRDLSLQDIVDQYEIRVALETYVLCSMAGRLTPEQVERVRTVLDAQKANGDVCNVERGVALDAEFHMLFCEFLANQEILRVMTQLREKMHRVIFRVFKLHPDRIASSYEEHKAIAQAVMEGDGSLAAKRLEEHLEYGKQRLLSPRRV